MTGVSLSQIQPLGSTRFAGLPGVHAPVVPAEPEAELPALPEELLPALPEELLPALPEELLPALPELLFPAVPEPLLPPVPGSADFGDAHPKASKLTAMKGATDGRIDPPKSRQAKPFGESTTTVVLPGLHLRVVVRWLTTRFGWEDTMQNPVSHFEIYGNDPNAL